jgi:hypothetical protein
VLQTNKEEKSKKSIQKSKSLQHKPSSQTLSIGSRSVRIPGYTWPIQSNSEAVALQEKMAIERTEIQRRLEQKITQLEALSPSERKLKKLRNYKIRLDAFTEVRERTRTLLAQAKWKAAGIANRRDFWALGKAPLEDRETTKEREKRSMQRLRDRISPLHKVAGFTSLACDSPYAAGALRTRGQTLHTSPLIR